MSCHMYSYRIRAVPASKTGGRPGDFMYAMHAKKLLAPMGPLVAELDESDGRTIRAKVNPNRNVIQCDDGIEAAMSEIAGRFPDYDIVLSSTDEEDASQSETVVWKDGEMAKSVCSRLVTPDELYDSDTVERILEILEQNCAGRLAPIIRAILEKDKAEVAC